MGFLNGGGRIEVAPKPAEELTLKKFHSAGYLHVLKNCEQGKFEAGAFSMGLGTGDCPIFKGMYDYAVLACGGTVTAANMILSGQADIAFNPSGGFHHAHPESASGFCYINDVAVGCALLAEAGKKVLYLDVDVHHGDGVGYGFYDRSDIMTISFHESGSTLFPGTGFVEEIGKDEGRGYCINVPLPIGTYDEVYLKAFESIAKPLVKSFAPDVIVFVLGADALAGDPLGHLQLTNNTYVKIIKHLLSFDKPVLMTGVGGYNIEDTVRAWALGWCVLSGADVEYDDINTEAGRQINDLRDKEVPVTAQQREIVKPIVDKVIDAVKSKVFGFHNI